VQAASGFWGPPTSSIDWCETNYAQSRFVAEWFNTTSSLALVAAGLLGFAQHALAGAQEPAHGLLVRREL